MSDVYFARTRHHYGTYDDLFKLAELSDFEVIYIDEIPTHDAPGKTFICSPLNGEWNQLPKGYTQGRMILYQLEWGIEGAPVIPECVTDVWCGDLAHAEKYNYKYVPLGSHPELNEYTWLPKVSQYNRYDVAFMGYKDPHRRARILHELYEAGVSIAPNGWGQVRSAALLDSKCMIGIHQWDNLQVLPPLRMCIAAAHKLTLITEEIENAGIFQFDIIQYPYDQLSAMTRLIVKDDINIPMLKGMGESLYQKLCCDYTFRKSIERAL